MTASGDFGFYFERVQRGATQGPIDPAEQYFRGSEIESLVRELGQNSIDARAGFEPVRMVFELRSVATAAIPGLQDIKRHAQFAAHFARDMAGHERIDQALEAADADSVPVLRVADFGTRGLGGDESMHAKGSALTALTRGAGVSDMDVKRGGSFGIGSAVGRLVSGLRTVLYRSLPEGKDEVVFAGKCRLASHFDDHEVPRAADGFYTRLSLKDDFEYLRSPQSFGPFVDRVDAGTDTFILDYTHADDDPRLVGVRNAVLENFLVALHRGTLVVEGRVEEELVWRLDEATVGDYAAEMSHVAPFYRALGDPSPYEGAVERLGHLRLFVEVDDRLDKKLNTIAVRGPLMKIDTYRHNSISLKYAAVLDCSDPNANEVLRELEPPEHNEWQGGRAPGGHQKVKAVKKFILEGLKSRVSESMGEELNVSGLARLLPSDLTAGGEDAEGAHVPTIGDPVPEEGTTTRGDDQPASDISVRHERAVRVGVREPATAAGSGEPIEKGKDRGGSGGTRQSGSGLPGDGEPGAGGSKIKRSNVSMRCWQASQPRTWVVVVKPEADVFGDLTLAALDSDGAPIEDLSLGITEVRRIDPESRTSVEISDNTLKNITLDAHETARFSLELDSARRFRIGVA